MLGLRSFANIAKSLEDRDELIDSRDPLNRPLVSRWATPPLACCVWPLEDGSDAPESGAEHFPD